MSSVKPIKILIRIVEKDTESTLWKSIENILIKDVKERLEESRKIVLVFVQKLDTEYNSTSQTNFLGPHP